MKLIPEAFVQRKTADNKSARSFSTSSSSLLSFSLLTGAEEQQQQHSFQSISSLLTSSTESAGMVSTTILTAPPAVTEAKAFEAVAPDTTILIGFGIVFVLSVIASYVWSEQVVPISRTKLALSKRNGEVKNYLDGLKEGSDTSSVNANAISTEEDGVANSESVSDSSSNSGDGRGLERWLFSDWLVNNKSAGGGGRKKEPALPFLKKAKWNSGDNPVVVTAAIMMVGILIASVTERVGTSGL